MNKFFLKLFFILILYCIAAITSHAAVPKYQLRAQNIVKTGPNSVEFDINILHTNPDSSNFEYAAGQYFFDFNIGIANGGTFTYSIVNSDLPSGLQPRNPVVYVVGGEMQLRLTINMIPAPGNGFPITSVGQGTKIVRMKLQTSALYFDSQFFHLNWRNGPANPYTKIFSYIGSALTEITTPGTHFVDSLNFPLPVELNNFSAKVSDNDVSLIWSTLRELNNKGFEVSRSQNKNEWTNIGFVKGYGQTDSVKEYFFNEKNLHPGQYYYRLKQLDYNGNFEYYYLKTEVIINSPKELFISQNYPNPFNPSTNIDFNLPYDSHVSISLYDVSGKEISTLINEFRTAGYYTIKLNVNEMGKNLSSGIYFYKMTVSGLQKNFILAKKLTLIK